MWKKKGSKKKGGCFIAVLLAIVLMSGTAFALYDSPNRQMETYVVTNSTGTSATTAVSTSTISPIHHRIIGYSIAPYDASKNTEWTVALVDYSSYQVDTYIFDEAEWGATDCKDPRIYPYPKKISTQLRVRQGDNSVVTIYYIDTRKY